MGGTSLEARSTIGRMLGVEEIDVAAVDERRVVESDRRT